MEDATDQNAADGGDGSSSDRGDVTVTDAGRVGALPGDWTRWRAAVGWLCVAGGLVFVAAIPIESYWRLIVEDALVFRDDHPLVVRLHLAFFLVAGQLELGIAAGVLALRATMDDSYFRTVTGVPLTVGAGLAALGLAVGGIDRLWWVAVNLPPTAATVGDHAALLAILVAPVGFFALAAAADRVSVVWSAASVLGVVLAGSLFVRWLTIESLLDTLSPTGVDLVVLGLAILSISVGFSLLGVAGERADALPVPVVVGLSVSLPILLSGKLVGDALTGSTPSAAGAVAYEMAYRGSIAVPALAVGYWILSREGTASLPSRGVPEETVDPVGPGNSSNPAGDSGGVADPPGGTDAREGTAGPAGDDSDG